MRVLLVLVMTLAGTATALHAQTTRSSDVPRRAFVEGALLGEYIDALGPAIEQWGGGAEVGFQVWQSETRKQRTASARIRAEVMEEMKALSFTVAPEYRWSRVGLELPIGLTLATGGSGATAGLLLAMGLPIVVSERIAVVPRTAGYLLFEDGIPGLMTTIGLGFRWRFK